MIQTNASYGEKVFIRDVMRYITFQEGFDSSKLSTIKISKWHEKSHQCYTLPMQYIQ